MEDNIDLSERTSQTHKTVGRSVSINGVHAVDMTVEKSENLNDPVINFNLKVNNPLGRLWLALQRIWQSQSTVIALKFTIPLLVLPIAIYVGYRLWQGRGVNQPVSKIGIVHEVQTSSGPRDILVLPTSDVYLLSYASDFAPTTRLTEKPVILIGVYNHLTSTLTVETMLAYRAEDFPLTTATLPGPKASVWDTLLRFIDQFR